jgi:hypothetical protein
MKDITNNLSAIWRKLVSCYTKLEQTGDGSIRAETYGPDEIATFVVMLTRTIPLARGMKLKNFPAEWDPTKSPPPAAGGRTVVNKLARNNSPA